MTEKETVTGEVVDEHEVSNGDKAVSFEFIDLKGETETNMFTELGTYKLVRVEE